MPGFRLATNAGDQNSIAFVKDVKRAHRWRISKFGTDIVGQPILTPDELLFAKSVEMPTIGFSEKEVLGGSIPYKFATQPNFSDLVVAFYDLEGLEPKIREWQSLVWGVDRGIGKANDYKSEVQLYLTNGQGNPVDSSWLFKNAWPKNINHGELVYDSSEFKLITVTVSYDWIEYPDVGAASGGITPAGFTAPTT